MGYGLILAGFILLFNPVINVYDVIPDLVGFLLIVAGLTKLSYFLDDIERSHKMFRNLVFVELAKLAAIFVISFAAPAEKGSLRVLFAFVFGFAEALMFAYAVVKLFDGLSSAVVKYGGSRFFDTVGKKQKTRSERTRNYIIFFYTFRCAATLVPELTELEMYDHIGEVSAFSRPLSYYKPALYVLLSIAVLVLAVVYIVKISRYFAYISRDAQFNQSFLREYTEAQKTRSMFFLSHRMMKSLLFFTIAVFTTYMLLIDDVNILVGAISAVFFGISAVLMSKHARHALVVIPFAVCRAITSALSTVLQVRFFGDYSTEAVEWVERAAAQYKTLSIVSIVDSVASAALHIVFVAILARAVGEHIRNSGTLGASAQYDKSSRDREVYSTVKKKLTANIVLAVIYSLSTAVYRFVVLSASEYIVINAIIFVVLIIQTMNLVGTVNNNVYEREIEIS